MQSKFIYVSYKWSSGLNKTQFDVDKLLDIIWNIAPAHKELWHFLLHWKGNYMRLQFLLGNFLLLKVIMALCENLTVFSAGGALWKHYE